MRFVTAEGKLMFNRRLTADQRRVLLGARIKKEPRIRRLSGV
jgi:hypothetical protein